MEKTRTAWLTDLPIPVEKRPGQLNKRVSGFTIGDFLHAQVPSHMVNSRCVRVSASLQKPRLSRQQHTCGIRSRARFDYHRVWKPGCTEGGQEGRAEWRSARWRRTDATGYGKELFPSHFTLTAGKKKHRVCEDNKRQVQEEEGKQVVSSVRQRTRNISAGGGSAVETAWAASPLCGSQSVVRIQQKSMGEVGGGGWFQVILGKIWSINMALIPLKVPPPSD